MSNFYKKSNQPNSLAFIQVAISNLDLFETQINGVKLTGILAQVLYTNVSLKFSVKLNNKNIQTCIRSEGHVQRIKYLN